MAYTLWIRTSNDKYELPLAVADSAEELARMCNSMGVSKRATANSIRSAVAHNSPHVHRIGYDGELLAD